MQIVLICYEIPKITAYYSSQENCFISNILCIALNVGMKNAKNVKVTVKVILCAQVRYSMKGLMVDFKTHHQNFHRVGNLG